MATAQRQVSVLPSAETVCFRHFGGTPFRSFNHTLSHYQADTTASREALAVVDARVRMCVLLRGNIGSSSEKTCRFCHTLLQSASLPLPDREPENVQQQQNGRLPAARLYITHSAVHEVVCRASDVVPVRRVRDGSNVTEG